jgi:hypothetical protein
MYHKIIQYQKIISYQKIIQDIEYDYQNYIQYFRQIRQKPGYYIQIENKKWKNLYNILEKIKNYMINSYFDIDDIDYIRICIHYIDLFFDIMKYDRKYDCSKFISAFNEVKLQNFWGYVKENMINTIIATYNTNVLGYYIKNNNLIINFSILQLYYPIEIFEHLFPNTNKDRIFILVQCLERTNNFLPIEIIQYIFNNFLEL